MSRPQGIMNVLEGSSECEGAEDAVIGSLSLMLYGCGCSVGSAGWQSTVERGQRTEPT